LTFEREENESFDVLGMTNTTPLNATLKSDKFNTLFYVTAIADIRQEGKVQTNTVA
jgi:hypothetical protein